MSKFQFKKVSFEEANSLDCDDWVFLGYDGMYHFKARHKKGEPGVKKKR